jgi:hypothetical protein
MLADLGMDGAQVLHLQDFTDAQVEQFLSGVGLQGSLPEWLPTRPLLLASMASSGMLGKLSEIDTALSPAPAWRQLMGMIAHRESMIYSTVPPETIRSLLSNLAVLSKMREGEHGELSLEDMKSAFTQVTGRQTDEEGVQLLLRLPGLAVATVGREEARVFSDEALAAAAFRESLAEYLASPYQGHVLCQAAAWPTASSELSVEVCAESLQQSGISPAQIRAACDHRNLQGYYDAILLDSIRVGDVLGAKSGNSSYMVADVSVDRLEVPAVDNSLLLRTHFRGSLIIELDLSQADVRVGMPTFDECVIGHVSGVVALRPAWAAHFRTSEIETFDDESFTTQGILSLDGLAMDQQVALSILHRSMQGAARGVRTLRYVGACPLAIGGT